jgi:hypothetical protein
MSKACGGTTVRKILDRVAATIDRLARDEPGDFGLIGNRAEMLNEFSLIYTPRRATLTGRGNPLKAAAGIFRDLAARFPRTIRRGRTIFRSASGDSAMPRCAWAIWHRRAPPPSRLSRRAAP